MLPSSYPNSLALCGLGQVVLRQGQLGRARELFSESLTICAERGDRRVGSESLTGLATVAAAEGDALRAIRLAGAVQAASQAMGIPIAHDNLELLEARVYPLREKVGSARFDAEIGEGNAMSFDESIRYALEGLKAEYAPTAQQPDAGEKIAGYEVEKVIGRGGMGVVYLAHQSSLDRSVALKLLSPGLAEDDGFRERFLREARSAALLEHPNVLPVYEAGEAAGRLFLAMRFVEGTDLATRLDEGPLDLAEAVAIVAQVAAALDAAHERGLVHRDVKPHNILLDGDHAYLCDFGLAKTAGDASGLTEAGTVMGTLDYLAPEAIERGEAGPAGDVYALACVLWECVRGEVLFPRETDVAKLWAHVHDPPPTFEEHAAFDLVMKRGLAKKPEERYGSASELARAAHEALTAPTVPVPATPDLWPEGVPRPPTRLVGRGEELAELVALVSGDETGLVTLAGAGGSGKTRLALELAARLASRYPDGIGFAELAPVRDAALVPSRIAQCLGLRETSGTTPEDAILGYASGRRLLICIDNVEHLLGAAPHIGRLSQAARVVVTSRTPLGLRGEVVYQVPPLEPDEAADLFIARAQAVKTSLILDDPTIETIRSICRRLDGLPLAIELAAARVRVLSPEAILRRLDERLKLLTVGHADLPDRQQTLRATIDWSHELLDPEEQRLFASMAVFVGGARPDAVEAVCDGDLDTLDALLQKSLLTVVDDPDGEPRFSMLETIREYAVEKLETDGVAAASLRRRHAEWFLELAEGALAAAGTPDSPRCFDRLEADHANLRAALAFALDRGDGELAARFGQALWEFWWARGHSIEGLESCRSIVALEPGDHVTSRAWTLMGAGVIAIHLTELSEARGFLEEALDVFRREGNELGIGGTLVNLGSCLSDLGELERVQAMFDEGLAFLEKAGFDPWVADAKNALAVHFADLGRVDEACPLFEESLAIQPEMRIRAGHRDLHWAISVRLSCSAATTSKPTGSCARACSWRARSRSRSLPARACTCLPG